MEHFVFCVIFIYTEKDVNYVLNHVTSRTYHKIVFSSMFFVRKLIFLIVLFVIKLLYCLFQSPIGLGISVI